MKTGVESRRRAEDRDGDVSADVSEDGNESSSEDGNGTGTKMGSGRAEERQISERNHTRVVDAMWETGENRVESEKI